MKDKNNFDSEIKKLFDEAAASFEPPSPEVTEKAKKMLAEEKSRQKSARLALNTGNVTHENVFLHGYRAYVVAAIAALLIVAAIIMFPVASKWLSGSDTGLSASTLSFGEEQLVRQEAEYTGLSFLPFVEEDEVVSFCRYTLKDPMSDNGKYDGVVMYSVEYRHKEKINVGVRVEVGEFRLRELASYKTIAADNAVGDINYERSGSSYRLYFRRGEYSYNIDVEGASDNEVYLLIDDIDGSF